MGHQPPARFPPPGGALLFTISSDSWGRPTRLALSLLSEEFIGFGLMAPRLLLEPGDLLLPLLVREGVHRPQLALFAVHRFFSFHPSSSVTGTPRAFASFRSVSMPGFFFCPASVAALHTGARRGELVRLTWADVDMKRKALTFRETKNGRDRTVPMTETLRREFQALPRPLDAGEPVLPRYGDPRALTRAFARHVKRLGIAGLTFHDLRHDAASTLTMAGVSQRAIMEILGHRDARMTVRYQHLAPGHLTDAMGALDRAAHRPGVDPEALADAQ